jgi:putative transposase
VLDSQSVNSGGHGGEVGYDAAKCIKGRKRHIMVDMPGFLLGVAVTQANCPEREGGKAVLEKLAGWLGRLRKIWVDAGYSGESFDQWVRQLHPKEEAEVVKRSESKGFKLLPKSPSEKSVETISGKPTEHDSAECDGNPTCRAALGFFVIPN